MTMSTAAEVEAAAQQFNGYVSHLLIVILHAIYLSFLCFV